MTSPTLVPQQAIPSTTDLREMLRGYLVRRGLACMEDSARRRERGCVSVEARVAYRQTIRSLLRELYGPLPAGPDATPPEATVVSAFSHPGFRIENVLFQSYPGWEVNASVFIPADRPPPFPVVIVPVGHSGKQFPSYQIPCQYFARAGFLTISFDPPGQSGEKQPGNDHFIDGVRDYLLGRTSSRYFVADAIRCIDYAATRQDADLAGGVAMTGVSGGGTTTMAAAAFDDRIALIAPSCCVQPLARLYIEECYAGCPEAMPFGRFAGGIDEADLLCAFAPKPCLLMVGEQDEVVHVQDTRQVAVEVAAHYAAANAADRFAFFVDSGGHAYSVAQARQFVHFVKRHLARGVSDTAERECPDAPCTLLPEEHLQCHPRQDVNMRTLAVAEAGRLAAGWDLSPQAIREAVAAVAGVTGSVLVPDAELGAAFHVWTHDWHAVMLRPEPGIELPATWLTARRDVPASAILHLDDTGRHRLLHRQGLLTAAIRFLDRDQPGAHLLTVDLRGWGDTAPGMYPYEMAGWGSVDRYLAYASAALGDPVMAMRIRDALAALAWLRVRPEIDPARIVLTASGLGGIVALHVAAIAGDVAGVVAWDGLASFRSLLSAERYPWPADSFLPNALRHYDLPELAGSLRCPVRLFGLRDGQGQPLDETGSARYHAVPHVVAIPEMDTARIVKGITTLLAEGMPAGGTSTASAAGPATRPGRGALKKCV